MKLQTTLAPDILHILLLVFSTILGVFWASYHISLYLTDLNQSPKNSIYPTQTTRPSGQRTQLRGDPKANIQQIQTHTSLQICSSNKKVSFKMGGCFTNISYLIKFPSCFLCTQPNKPENFDSPCDWLPQGPGTPKNGGKYHLALWASWLPVLSLRAFFPAKTAFRWKSWGLSLWKKTSFFWKSSESRNHKSCEESRKSPGRFAFSRVAYVDRLRELHVLKFFKQIMHTPFK